MRSIAVLLALAVLVAGQAQPKPRTVRLKRIGVKEGTYRLGWGMEGAVPRSAYRCRVGKDDLVLWDLDADGKLEGDKQDGLSMKGTPFIVRLPSVLLISSGQYSLSFRGTSQVLLVAETLNLPKKVIAGAAEMTRVRLRAGLSPAVLDEQACEDCVAHARYLRLNGMGSGLSPHNEDASRPGYTARGAAAGTGSVMAPSSPGMREAIKGWAATVWHGAPLLAPGVRRFGVVDQPHVAMLYTLGRSWPRTPLVHPSDGATGIPRAFGKRGERPNPVPGTNGGRGCGFPVMVLLPSGWTDKQLTSVTLVDSRGRQVKGTHSSPANPANPSWPSNSGCAAFVPKGPLSGKTRYRARFVFAGEKPVEWSFTTGNK